MSYSDRQGMLRGLQCSGGLEAEEAKDSVACGESQRDRPSVVTMKKVKPRSSTPNVD